MRLAFFFTAVVALWGVPDTAFSQEEIDELEDFEAVEDVDLELEDIEEEEPPPVWDSQTWSDPDLFSRNDRVINLLRARTIRPLSLAILIDHRANQAFSEEPFKDYFGLDAGALKIGTGLRFGILDDLDIGIYRLNGTKEIFDTYELDLRFQVTNQEDHFVDLAVRGGATWFYQPGADDAGGGFGQILVNRQLFDRVLIGLALLFHSDSSNFTKTGDDQNWSLAAGGMLEVRILRFLAWDFELIGSLAGYGARYPSWSTAIKMITHRHTFSLVVSSTQYINADGIVTGSAREPDETIIGFQITREIEF